MKAGVKSQFYYNGTDLFPALLDLIQQSREEILIALFSFRFDETGKKFIEALCQKAREGVEVRVLFDAMGSTTHGKKVENVLRAAGVEVRAFRRFSSIWLLHFPAYWCRNHARIFLFDRKVFGVGGTGFGNQYLKRPDLSLLAPLDNPRPILEYYERLWSLANTASSSIADPSSGKISEDFSLLFSGSQKTEQTSYQFLQQSLAEAQKRIIIMVPFFFPPQDILRELVDAQKRGVEVEVITPSHTDKPRYDVFRALPAPILIRQGVVWRGTNEYFHHKIILIDDEWTMGSLNFEMIGLKRQYELNVRSKDQALLEELERLVNEARRPERSHREVPWSPLLFKKFGSFSYTLVEKILSIT